MSQIHSDNTEIEIEETNDRIKIPYKALRFLGDILKAMSEGQSISIVPIAEDYLDTFGLKTKSADDFLTDIIDLSPDQAIVAMIHKLEKAIIGL